ncbi:hypothetical protein HNR40_004071 [Nonomuraea endophytica]|uniref:Uncharacterized protein n=1 Tax=Nonomuraea endophytica TaxID=714136 RepID=A0A7W8A311_9ACTN|nr:hypothetical protein [Nonomuraea endophytica]MBB5078585.1 hypothetical protein [Nonomuraea endophytica]
MPRTAALEELTQGQGGVVGAVGVHAVEDDVAAPGGQHVALGGQAVGVLDAEPGQAGVAVPEPDGHGGAGVGPVGGGHPLDAGVGEDLPDDGLGVRVALAGTDQSHDGGDREAVGAGLQLLGHGGEPEGAGRGGSGDEQGSREEAGG